MKIKRQMSSRSRYWLVILKVVGRCRRSDSAFSEHAVHYTVLEGASQRKVPQVCAECGDPE